MQIDSLHLHTIALPFSGHFPHALQKGAFATNIVCELIADGGRIRGYGEGAPRTYVTGETPESVFEAITRFSRFDNFPRNFEGISQLWNFIDALPSGRKHHAAVCALETALLDALGKKEGRYLTAYFPKDFITDKIHYSATVPLLDPKGIERFCRRIKEYGIHRMRLKVGNVCAQNRTNLETIRSIFENGCDLKIDANGSWDKAVAFEHLPLIERHRIRVIEQPMNPQDPAFIVFSGHMKRLNVLMMADESICSLDDMDAAVEQGFTMVNVRLSKCGGFRKSLQLIDAARKRGLRFQIGCHLGESGILSAAGRILGLLCKDAAYYDGSYDAYLLKENVTTQPVSFERGGEAAALGGFGLGVEVDPRSLQRLSTAFSRVSIS